MTEHTKTDGLPESMPLTDTAPQVLDKSRPRSERMASDKIECNACPVLCQISPGRTGACDRYANAEGVLIRVDPVVLLRRTVEAGDAALVPFVARSAEVAAQAHANPLATHGDIFVTGIGSSTTYPDYKPAPFIVASNVEGVDMVTVVT
jgi:6-hydroxynicotinate reductase